MQDETPGKAMKRRGILAAAGAVVAGIVAKQTSQPVAATESNTDFVATGGSGGAFTNGPNYSYGVNVSGGVAGVKGMTTTGYGVLGVAGDNGTGVQGEATNGNGVYGRATSGGGAGVYGSGLTYGVYGTVPDGGGNGVFGIGAGASTGVQGKSTSGYGLYSTTGSATAPAIYGLNSSSGTGIIGKTTTGLYGIVGYSGTSQGSAGLLGVATGPNAIGFGTVTQNGATFAGYFNGTTVVNGTFAVTGSKSAAVKDASGEYRLMYSVESPEAWFEDFGTGTLTNGKADMKLDPLFTHHIHTDQYHVFLTEYGGHNDLCVDKRTAGGFEVHAKDGTGSGTFSYRVVAKRADITGERLAKFTMPPALVASDVPPAPPTPPTPVPTTRPSGADASTPAPIPAAAPTVQAAPSGQPAPLPPSR